MPIKQAYSCRNSACNSYPSHYWSMPLFVLQPGLLFTATLLSNLFLVAVNSQSTTTTWHAYNQSLVKTLSNTEACKHYWSLPKPSSTQELKNTTSPSSRQSEFRLWPGNVSLLQLSMKPSIAFTTFMACNLRGST